MLLLPIYKKSYFCSTTQNVCKSINLFLLSLSSLKKIISWLQKRQYALLIWKNFNVDFIKKNKLPY